MSRKKAAGGSGLESEDDLLDDGGGGVFKMEDDEIDEEALLGLGDDDTGYLQADLSGADIEDPFGKEQDELLEIGVDEEEINELAGEEESFGNQKVMLEEEEEVEQLDYVDDILPADQPDVQVEYDDNMVESTVSETDLSQDEGQQMSLTQSSFNDTPSQTLTESKESDSESEDSEGEKTGRGRFKSERPNIIAIGKTKSRTNIPDTLEVSAEQQAQIDQFPDRRQRSRNRPDRGRGRDQQQRGFHGNSNSNQQTGIPTQMSPGQPYPQRGNLRQNQTFPLPPFGDQRGLMNRMPMLGNRGQGGLLRGPLPLRGQGPQSLIDRGMGVPNQGRGFTMARPPHQGGLPQHLMPGSVPPPSMVGLDGPRPVFQQRTPLSQPAVLRPAVPVSGITTRPHTIHINPNFRGNFPSTVSTITPLVQSRSPFSQPSATSSSFRLPAGSQTMAGGGGSILAQGPVHSGMQGHQPFGQSQGFQQGPRMGAPPNQSGAGAVPGHQQQHQQQQQPRFGSTGPGMVQGGPLGSPVRHPPTSAAGFQGQPMALPQMQNPPSFPGFGNPPPSSSHVPHQTPTSAGRFATPQQGVYRGPSPQQQLQQQQMARPGMFQRRNAGGGVQPQKGVALQNRGTVTMARKLTQQARNVQKFKAAAQMANKNITVIPLKRQSSDNVDSGVSPNKVARVVEDSIVTEDDLELKRGLEEQKRLREMIRKRKEEARCRQAEVRRKELESRLKEKGMTLEDIEGKPSEETNAEMAAPVTPQGAQKIKTVVTQGGKKQLITATRRLQSACSKQLLRKQQQAAAPQEVHQEGPPLSSGPPGQFQGPPFQQPPPAVFTSAPPQQAQMTPRMVTNPEFNPQFPPPRLTHPPPPTPQLQGPQVPPVVPPPSPYRQPSRPAAPGALQPQRMARQAVPPPNRPPPPTPHQQQFGQRAAGKTFTAVRHMQQTNSAPPPAGATVGRGAAMAMAHGGQGQMGRGRGQAMVRGQVPSQGVRGRGQAMGGWGRGLPRPQQPVATSSPSPQPPSSRTVMPLGRGRVVTRGSAVTRSAIPANGRTVVQRQVMAHPVPVGVKLQQSMGGGIQKVSIDNLALGTTELQIRQGCEAIGPVMGIVMIESQRKAIVTFANKMHAAMFAKQWNRRMINMSMVSVTLLP